MLDIRTAYNGENSNTAGISVRKQCNYILDIIRAFQDLVLIDKNVIIPNRNDVIDNSYFLIYFENPTFVKSFTPNYSAEGTLKYCYVNVPNFEEGMNVQLGEEYTINTGDTIIINKFLSKNYCIAIKNDTGKYNYCGKNQNQGTSTNVPGLCRIQLQDNTIHQITQLSANSISGIFELLDFDQNLYNNIQNIIEFINNINYTHNYLNGKKVIAIGDSMTKGHSLDDNKTWLYYLANRNNMSYVNYGVNGAFLSSRNYGNYTGVVNNFQNMDNDADYIIVFAGTNDIQASVALGEENSTDTTTFYGALNTLCQGLLNMYPNKKICFITPYARNNIKSRCETYVNAIKTACKNNGGIPVFDNILNGGIDWANTSQINSLTLKDSYHLNADGMLYVSYKYENFLRSL